MTLLNETLLPFNTPLIPDRPHKETEIFPQLLESNRKNELRSSLHLHLFELRMDPDPALSPN